jgi:hypothetical protein
MNCLMMDGMTSGVTARSEVALFCQQMIPHHQNAVNMAKALLITSTLSCSDITNQKDQDCILENILRDIINSQNYQIQLMRVYLRSKGYPLTDNCVVQVETLSIDGSISTLSSIGAGNESKSSTTSGVPSPPLSKALVVFALAAMLML